MMSHHTVFPLGPRATRRLIVVVGTLPLLGCGDSRREAFHVSGTVISNGQPIPVGIVLFDPDIAAGNDGLQGFAEIQEGRFDTAVGKGRGVSGGAYVIKVRGGLLRPDAPKAKVFTYEQKVTLPAGPSRHDLEIPPAAVADGRPFPDST